jgi:hypothetical protein
MSERTLEILSERLDRLERENSWWRRVGLSLLLATVAIATLGQTPAPSVPKVIQAERFLLLDAGGNVRGELGITDAGMPRLLLRQPGAVEETAFAELHPAGLALHDGRGLPYLWMGPSGFSLYSGTTQARITMRIGDDNGPLLSFTDESGATRAALGRTRRQEERGGTLERLPTYSLAPYSLVLLDKDGKVIWETPPPAFQWPEPAQR